MSERIIITTDSPADLPTELFERYEDIAVIPLHITLGDESFRDDGVSVTPQRLESFFDETGVLPKTASVSVAEYIGIFSEYTREGASVVHLSLSSGISSTYHNAVLAAAELSGVYVVDTFALCSSMALLLIKACELRSKGVGAKEIADAVLTLRDKTITTFIIENLGWLSKGGRCSGATALGANILGIKPCIEMHGGVLSVGKKYRGKFTQCQLSYVSDVLSAYKPDGKTAILAFTDGMSSEQEEALKKQIKRTHGFKEILTAHPGCTITAHCGPNTAAVFFITE